MSKHTLEYWDVKEDDYGDKVWYGGEGCGTVYVGQFSSGGCKRDPDAWAKLRAEAHLLADALRIHHETGLTPRQLADQRKELLEALKEARDGLRYWEPVTERGHAEKARITAKVHTAIANAEGQP